MLGTLENCQKANSKSDINTLVHAYNSTINNTTGFSSYFSCSGESESYLYMSSVDCLDQCTNKYIENMKLRLQEAHRQAMTATKASQNRQKFNYDLRVRAATLRIGDRVLVEIWRETQNSGQVGGQPVYDYFPTQEDIPVFKGRWEDGEGRCKVLHRNLMLLIGTKFPIVRPTSPKPKPRKKEGA